MIAKNPGTLQLSLLDDETALDNDATVAVLTPIDVEESLLLAAQSEIDFKVTMLDPWYNKGVGGTREDYVEYVLHLLDLASRVSPHTYLWGFPEIVSHSLAVCPKTSS